MPPKKGNRGGRGGRGGASGQPNLDGVRTDGDSQAEKYSLFRDRIYYSTRWLDPTALSVLGLTHEVTRIFNKIRIGDFITRSWPTYRYLTAEFFSSLTVDINRRTDRVTLKFRLGNEDRELSLSELNRIYGFPDDADVVDIPTDEQSNFWYKLTGLSGYKGQDANSADIVNPCYRIAHRIIANTIFARSEAGNVRVGELTVMWCMSEGKKLNLGFQLAGKLRQVARSSTGPICIGGLITPIALHFGIDLERYSSLENVQYIDISHLRSMNMIKRDGEHLYLAFTRFPTQITLPCPSKMNTEVADNWFESWVLQHRPPREDVPGEAAEDEIHAPAAVPAIESIPSASVPPRHPERGSSSRSSIPPAGTSAPSDPIDMSYFRGQFESLHRGMANLRSYVHDEVSGLRTYVHDEIAAVQEQPQQIFRMAQETYFHTFGRHFDPTVPWPPPSSS